MKKTLYILLGLCLSTLAFAQWSGTNPIYYNGGNVGIGTTSPNSQLIVGNNFGASISGSSGGYGVFGSNIAIQNGGANHNKLYTPYSHTNNYGYAGIQTSWGEIQFFTQSSNTNSFQVISPISRMIIDSDGNIGIGTTTPTQKLEVNGTIRSKKVKVEANDWPDYVFADNYQLPTLGEIENFIKTNGHLPEVLSAKEVEQNGLDLGDMEATLLKKVEELTLYLIEKDKEVNDLKIRLSKLEKLIKTLSKDKK